MQKIRRKLLFICAANLCRSPTAEHMFSPTDLNYEVKSAGMADGSVVPIDQDLIEWADNVYVMEDWMRIELLMRFRIHYLKIKVLNIPDRYSYGHPILVRHLTEALKKQEVQVDKKHTDEFFKNVGLPLWMEVKQ